MPMDWQIGNGLIFFSPNNPDKPFDFRNQWYASLKRARIGNFRFHDLRHIAAGYLVMAGATLQDAGQILGHKSEQTTQRYAHLSTYHKSERPPMSKANTVVVLDFETTGLSPAYGDRAIEIGAVKIEEGEIKDRFQELMNPGRPVDSFIENYTGITNDMLKDARSCKEVMSDFADFIGDNNLVAHNASFDKRFLDAEFRRLSKKYTGKFSCSMLLSRRLYQDAANHQLATLVRYAKIPSDGDFHRALYDSEMTAKLWLVMLEHINSHYGLSSIPFALTQKLTKIQKHKVSDFLKRQTSD